jgi:hypothetical protein
MLKKNLIVIAIAALVLVFTGNAFGQQNPDIDKIKKGKTTGIKSPRDVASGQATGIVEVYEGKGGVLYKRTGTNQTAQNRILGDTATHERRRKRKN